MSVLGITLKLLLLIITIVGISSLVLYDQTTPQQTEDPIYGYWCVEYENKRIFPIDDFIVPLGEQWQISGIGMYVHDSANVVGWTVGIWKDPPDINAPYAQETKLNIQSTQPAHLPFSAPVICDEGTYWVGIYASQRSYEKNESTLADLLKPMNSPINQRLRLFNGDCLEPTKVGCGKNFVELVVNFTDLRFEIDGIQTQKHHISSGTIVAIVVSVIVCLLIIVILSIIIILSVLKKRKSKKTADPSVQQSEYLKDVKVIDKIGSGNFGNVYYGLWNGSKVALKQCKDVSNKKEFSKEMEIFKNLNHPHIIRMYGLYKNGQEELFIVMEFMELGSLDNFILEKKSQLHFADLLDFASQACQGMVYLSEHGIIHRDLALRNILVTQHAEKYLVKIADFGLSCLLGQKKEYYSNIGSSFALKWSAPEVFEKGKCFKSSDVWSFGIVMYEIFSYGSKPYVGLSNKEIRDKILEGYREKVPKDCPEEIGLLMNECWNFEPEKRPSFEQILKIITEEDWKSQSARLNSNITHSLEEEQSIIYQTDSLRNIYTRQV